MKQVYFTLLLVSGFFASLQLQSQNCPPTGFTNGNTLYFFYDAGISDCVERPNIVMVGGSEFELSECGAIFSVYNLNSGRPLTSFSPFTADFGFGTCEYTDGNLTDQTLSIAQLDSFLRATKLYPNPVTSGNKIQLTNSGKFSGKVNIYSLTGKLVVTKSLDNFYSSLIDISNLSNGVYIVKIESASVSVTKKLIISK